MNLMCFCTIVSFCHIQAVLIENYNFNSEGLLVLKAYFLNLHQVGESFWAKNPSESGFEPSSSEPQSKCNISLGTTWKLNLVD